MQTPFTVNGKPFFILGGQVHNSSGYGAHTMETAWKALETLHANTAEAPVYWEQVEPEEGKFTFAHLDEIIAGARQRNLRLVLLWFATWKNGSMQYAPRWVKSNPQCFRPVLNPAGRPVWVLSSHCQATFEADRAAFCALLAHLKQVDSAERTVIGVQIENEPGILNSIRDYSPEAQAEFESPVPAELLNALQKTTAGDWETVFGADAAEFFTAWSVARYIDGIAEAGKQVYDLPVYVNVWLRENGWWLPGGNYPSGGPTTNVLDLWKCATPHIDLIAPDIYLENPDLYNFICQSYKRPDNPLFVPESGRTLANALNMFEAIGRYAAVGYAMFGIESLFTAEGEIKPESVQTVESFRCAAAALPLIERFHGTDKIIPVLQREFLSEQRMDLGNYVGAARFFSGARPAFTDYRHRPVDTLQRGRGLIFMPNAKEFYLVGGGFSLMLKEKVSDRQEFSQANDQFDGPLTHYLTVEEGHFDPSGAWVVDRYRNGDEITGGLWITPDVGVLHAILA